MLTLMGFGCDTFTLNFNDVQFYLNSVKCQYSLCMCMALAGLEGTIYLKSCMELKADVWVKDIYFTVSLSN